uniref:Protein O-mannosyltransferase 1 n=1 Tax=Glossina brevipalpis TaxID=37001 RepID=A0A1A9WGH5_9MUSC
MSSTQHNLVQRRKVTKLKALKNFNNETAITTTTTMIAVNRSTDYKNERFQRCQEGNKLEHLVDTSRKTAFTSASASSKAYSTLATVAAAALCNGNITAFVNCCRDVNCRLETTVCGCQPFYDIQRDSWSKESSTVCSNNCSSSCLADYQSQPQQQQHPGLEDENYQEPTESGIRSTSIRGSENSTTFSQLQQEKFVLQLQLDLFSWVLFLIAFCTRFYRLNMPRDVVFDELHYGKFISHYVRHIFFFDQHPPLGKQLIATFVSGLDYNGNFTSTRIGSHYSQTVPIFWLRFVPALFGSLLPSAVYHLLHESGISRWCSLLGGLLVIFDNALLTQSRFILMESMLLLFGVLGLCMLLKFQKTSFSKPVWIFYGIAAASLLTCAVCVKYVGFLTYCLAGYLVIKHLWDLLYDATISNLQICLQTVVQFIIFTVLPLCLYLFVFYIHLQTLYRAGPHDSVMTSAFQASLEGGLASITKGQPLKIAHGSQITLRHTHGRTCWLHSHTHVYPLRYIDRRGSSHQQQVTCYSFKDVNNWWIVKRPERDDLVVENEPDIIRHGDIIQLVHGITSRALNSHDVAAPMTPQCQEVSCYIDYDVNMKGELLWRVDILNKESEGSIWHAIKSEVRLIHVSTGAALRFTGRQLPEWGFNQHEVAGDRVKDNKDAIWNVEEHRYTKDQDEHEREQQLLKAEMLPTKPTKLTFFQKFLELQAKMFWHGPQIQSHMYSSEPLEWPLLTKGIAYWLDTKSNGQIYLLGNILIWYTGSIAVLIYAVLGLFYILRKQRLCYDIDFQEWQRFLTIGHIYFVGYLMHYLPFFFVERTLFLHHYLPAFLFKLLLLCYVVEHIDYLFRRYCGRLWWMVRLYRLLVLLWLMTIVAIYIRFLPISYGLKKLTADEIIKLRWKDTWDFVLQRDTLLH